MAAPASIRPAPISSGPNRRDTGLGRRSAATPMRSTPASHRQAAPWALLALVIAYGTIHRLGRTYGSTSHERRACMPGDDIVPRPQFVITHAITIEAPAAAVWPWLVQMGWHRGGWYTARWVDELLFPANRASADHIVEELQDLQVGDVIPDGPPETECGFMVEQLASPQLLVLHSTSHLPLEWRRSGKGHGFSTWWQSRMTIGRG